MVEVVGQEMGMMTDSPEIAEELMNMSMSDINNQAFLKNRIPRKLRKYIDMENIAESLDSDQLEKISSVVIQSYETDKQSRSEWESLMEKAFELVNNSLEVKNSPWEQAANIHYPLILSSCIQFNARTNPEIIKNENVVSVRLMIEDDDRHIRSDRAKRLSDHMSYQLLSQSDHWVRDTDKLLIMLPMIGVVYRKSFFNNINGMPDTQLCLPRDVIINNNVRSLELAQRITHLLYMTSNEILENMRAGLFLEYELDTLTSEHNELNELNVTNQNLFSYSIDEKKNRNLQDATHELCEQHRYLDLDGDGYQEPYIVTVHKSSGKVLRIVARYDESSFEYNDEGAFVKINPIHYFTDYHFITNPDGSFHSLGYGILLYPINETINSILNQLLDAGTLSNLQSGFIGKDLRLPKGDFRFRPGEWKQVATAAGTAIGQNIYPMPVKEPSQTLFSLLSFLIESARTITAVSEVMSGGLPSANVPAATVMALIEQGQQIYSSILYRIYDSLKKEFTKLYDINRKYLQYEEQFPIAQGIGFISIEDYMQPNYGIFPVADPKLSSGVERLIQAQALLQLKDYPQINPMRILENYLQVLKVQNPAEYIIPPDPNAPPSPIEQLTEAQIRNVNMETACKLIDRELKAWSTGIDEMKVKSQSAYYGGQLAGDKVDSIVKLSEAEMKVPPEELERAAAEEEILTRGTQLQAVPPMEYEKLRQLGLLPAELLEELQRQQVAPSPPIGPEGMPPMPMEGGMLPGTMGEGMPPIPPGEEGGPGPVE